MGHKTIVWDNIGNVLTGVREWHEWPPYIQRQLLAEDPHAKEHARSLREMFADDPLDIYRAKTLADVEGAIEDAEFLVVHKETLPAETLMRAKHLKLLQHLGLDYRGLPVDTAKRLGIPVAVAPLVNYLAVAEHAWAMILNYLKKLDKQQLHIQRRAYFETWGTFPGILLARDLTLGLVGLGEIGRPMARIARSLEMNVLYWDRVRFPEWEQQYQLSYVDWETLFRQSDIVSLHLPIKPETEKIVGSREIQWMKEKALLVNTARGRLVDPDALRRAVTGRQIGGVALDVFWDEPLPADDEWHRLHEDETLCVTLTPHSAWQSPWTWVRDSQAIWNDVRRVLNGEPPLYAV
jgi:D-3-phosphoglycerate dehydrogenase